jgi:GxxExxY protein
MSQYLFEEETYQIIGILFEVHKNLGKGFSEIVYKDALEFEFNNAKIPFEKRERICCKLQRHYFKT